MPPSHHAIWRLAPSLRPQVKASDPEEKEDDEICLKLLVANAPSLVVGTYDECVADDAWIELLAPLAQSLHIIEIVLYEYLMLIT